MHTETLLNPFYFADYCMKDDGTDFTVFTQIQEEDNSGNVDDRQKMDAVEDILLDDFSIGDDSQDDGDD